VDRTYTFERADTLEGFRSNQRASTDAINAVVSLIGGRESWQFDEFTDQDDPRPRIRIRSPDGVQWEEFDAPDDHLKVLHQWSPQNAPAPRSFSHLEIAERA